jgi:hypothetical protein
MVYHTNFIKFEENAWKTFHGGLKYLKYNPKSIRHICHENGEEHNPCLLVLYQMYIGLVQFKAKGNDAFYFRPNQSKLSFDNGPVRVNKLNAILPKMCKEVGIKVKTAYCLSYMCHEPV